MNAEFIRMQREHAEKLYHRLHEPLKFVLHETKYIAKYRDGVLTWSKNDISQTDFLKEVENFKKVIDKHVNHYINEITNEITKEVFRQHGYAI